MTASMSHLECLGLAAVIVYIFNICANIAILHTIIHFMQYRLKECVLKTRDFLVCEKVLVFPVPSSIQSLARDQ